MPSFSKLDRAFFAAAPLLIVVSLDGFRADYLGRHPAPTLEALAAGGLHAREGMIPVFPTKTFPNHYSLATGLYPAHHGIVSNTIYDPARDAWFKKADEDAQQESAWWGGEPIWVTAEKQGTRSAVMFWVGSEAEIGGKRPSYWRHYDGRLSGTKRVDQVLAWLDLPAPSRPSLVLVYFSDVDSAGHRHGPDAEETKKAVVRVDGYLRRLLDGLASRSLVATTNLIVVADHGMAAIAPERTIYLEDYIDLGDVTIVDPSPVLMLRPREGRFEKVYDALRGAHPRLAVHRREELPARLHFTGNDRIPPLVAIADEGWSVKATRKSGVAAAADEGLAGMHGYDNALASMRALFVASGPAFRRGTAPPFEAVEVYELMAAVLGLTPAPNDGKRSFARGLLVDRGVPAAP